MGQYGLTKDEVQELLWHDFCKWMAGGTALIDDDSNENYHQRDVDIFLESKWERSYNA